MSANGLTTIYNNQEGSGWHKLTLSDSSAATVDFPSHWDNDQSGFFEFMVLQGTGAAQFVFYSSSVVTEIPIRVIADISAATGATAGANVPRMVPALLGTTAVATASTFYLQKNNTNGRLRLLQTTDATRHSATVYVRRYQVV
jgi:hypothetical protein